MAEATALSVLCLGWYGNKCFMSWLESQKVESVNDTIQKELNDIKAHVSGLMIKNSVRATVPTDQTMKKFF